MMLDFIKVSSAQQNFKIRDDFEFVAFDDMTSEGMTEDSSVPQELEIWAAVKINYEGIIPDSYKVLNLIIGDWVNSHVDPLTKAIHGQLKGHFQAIYPGSDHSELDDAEKSTIWTEQLEYMPRIDDDLKSIVIEIELVLPTEPVGEEQSTTHG